MADLNERLLAQKENEDEAVAGELNASKRGNDLDETSDDSSSDGEPTKQAGVINQDKKEKEKKVNKGKNIAKSAVSGLALILAGLLRMAWGNLLSSYGLTLIWIDIHIIGNLAFGDKIFCDPGKEWTMRAAQSKTVQSGLKKEEEGKEMISKGATIIETMTVCCCNLGCFLLILAILTIIAMLFDIASAGILKNIGRLFGWIWDRVFRRAGDGDFE